MPRNCVWLCAFLLASAGLAGCDPAGETGNNAFKFDATSVATSLQSLQKMSEGMTEEQKKEFGEGATAVAFRANSGTQNGASAETFWKGVHGMTKAEIEAKAREIKAQEAAGKPN